MTEKQKKLSLTIMKMKYWKRTKAESLNRHIR